MLKEYFHLTMKQTELFRSRSRSWTAKSGGKSACNKFISKFSWEQHLWDRKETTGQSGELDCCCSHDKGSANPRGALSWNGPLELDPGLYTSAYPVTGCSLVPDTSKDFNLKKKKKKLLLNQEQFLEKADSWGLCAGSTQLGEILSAFWKRNWGGSRAHGNFIRIEGL